MLYLFLLKTESLDNAIILSKYGNCTRLLKLKTSWKSVVFIDKVGKNSRYFVGVFNKTIIPFALIGYEMITGNLYPTRTRGIIVQYTNVLLTQCGVKMAEYWPSSFMRFCSSMSIYI